jgi:cytochrome b involved in lipid metabolism
MRIPPSVLKTHNKKDDAWTAINGKVYNVTPYLSFHPGGQKQLMRVAGRDGTKLFGEPLRILDIGHVLNAMSQRSLTLGSMLNSCWTHAWLDF